MNNDYRIEPCELNHFYDLKARAYDEQMLSLIDSKEFLQQYVSKSYAFTGFYRNDIIGIAGILPMWPGVAEAWMFLGNDLYKHRRFVYKQVKEHLNEVFNLLKIKRLQLVCQANFNKAHCFAEHLGFVKEAFMKNYGLDGSDFLLYARIKND